MDNLEQFQKQYLFPNRENWPANGPVAWGGSLVSGRLISAYSQGIFPWYSPQEPILWWSPDPRCVLFTDRFVVSHSLSRELKKKYWSLRVDTQFKNVIEACSKVLRPRQTGTWLSQEMIAAYLTLHQMGLAHSFEVYYGDQLVGGLYGISLGKIFFGESMFSYKTNASKIALVYLVKLLKYWRFDMIDCQVYNAHLASLGTENIARTAFLKRLDVALKATAPVGPWTEIFENLLHNGL